MKKKFKGKFIFPVVLLSLILLVLFLNLSIKKNNNVVESADHHPLVVLGIEEFVKPTAFDIDYMGDYTSTSSFDLEYIVITETPIPTPTFTPSPTPTNTPTPKPLPPAAGQLEEWFTKYSSEYSVSRETLKKIAACESGYNSTSNSGTYGGMFQFSVGAWISARSRMNMDTNPDLRFSAEESIRTAAFKISVDGTKAWPSCSK